MCYVKRPTQVWHKDLDTLQLWEKYNKMEFHPGKCQVIKITNKQKPILSTYSIHGTTLQFFDAVKYLGINIDSHLCWKDQCENVYRKANSMISFLERNFSDATVMLRKNVSMHW